MSSSQALFRVLVENQSASFKKRRSFITSKLCNNGEEKSYDVTFHDAETISNWISCNPLHLGLNLKDSKNVNSNLSRINTNVEIKENGNEWKNLKRLLGKVPNSPINTKALSEETKELVKKKAKTNKTDADSELCLAIQQLKLENKVIDEENCWLIERGGEISIGTEEELDMKLSLLKMSFEERRVYCLKRAIVNLKKARSEKTKNELRCCTFKPRLNFCQNKY